MTDTTTDLAERLETIRGWAADAEPATDAPGAAALRVIGHLCDVVQQLTDRVLALELEVERYANNVASTEREIDELRQDVHPAIERAIRVHRDTAHFS